MSIPENIVQILNDKLNSTPRPHLTYLGNEQIDTGFLEWSLPPPDYESNNILDVDELLKNIRELLAGYPVFAYKSGLGWLDITEMMANSIVVAPVTDQFEVLSLEQIEAANYGLVTKDIIRKLKELNEKYGIDITAASYGAVEFLLENIPKDDDAQQLGEWLLDFCPDIYEAPTEFPEGKVALWWD